MIKRSGRVLAIDFGTVRMGLAISDENQKFSSPYENYTRVTLEEDGRYLNRVIAKEGVCGVVVGLPIHLDGRESAKSQEARQFGSWLADLSGLPLMYFDERLTSIEAEQWLRSANLSRQKRKQRRDMMAAQLLLAAFLEADRELLDQTPGSLE